MKRYKTRFGVVQTEVCGEYLLVAADSLRELCPYVTVINETSVFLWNRLKSGASADELIQAAAEEYEVDDPAELRGAIEGFLQQMLEMNYIVADEKGD